MSVEANVKIDDTAEVEDFLLSAGKPMKVEDVCTALTHIPKERVDSIIKFDSLTVASAEMPKVNTSMRTFLKSQSRSLRRSLQLLMALSPKMDTQSGQIYGI